MSKYKWIVPGFCAFLVGCPSNTKDFLKPTKDVTYQSKPISDFWKNATVYFLLTDRFYNGDRSNDFQYDRQRDGAVLRSFEGGDLAGVLAKIEEGYFDSLGVNAIWMSPIFEQIKSHTDEGTGKTYGYHGYWTRDWTQLDPNFGTEAELAVLVKTAHKHNIRILLDVVINHTGPITITDTRWPDDWVRTGPKCSFQDLQSTVECTLVENLPDIRTDSDGEVVLPDFLKEKWLREGRFEQESTAIDQYFERTSYPRYPHHYIIKWLVDWVRKYGIDGFRVDTTKHTEAYVWSVLKIECEKGLNAWREENPQEKLDDLPFYMVGEIYGYGISAGRDYDYGDQKVDFYNYGYESLINFEFKSDAEKDYETIFSKYSQLLNGPEMRGQSVLNYLSSHDDGSPFDSARKRTFESATKLLLAPGAAQIYYGDELARKLQVEGANGDANLRSNMNWEDISQDQTKELLGHWRKLGKFRSKNPAVGAGKHLLLQTKPYVFKRVLESQNQNSVVVGLDLPIGEKEIPVGDAFAEGAKIRDHYSGEEVMVVHGKVSLSSPHEIVLLGIDP